MDKIEQLKTQNLKRYIENQVGKNASHVGKGTYRFKKCPICYQGDHFTIDTTKNLWNTFGNCGGGSIIDFVMAYHGLDKKNAIARLCEEFNIQDEAKKVNEAKSKEQPSQTVNVDLTSIIQDNYNINKSIDYYSKRLLNNNKYLNDEMLVENFDKLATRYKFLTGPPQEILKKAEGIVPKFNNISAYEYIIPVWENGKVVNCILRRNDEKSTGNQKASNLKNLPVKFFNADYLKNKNKIIFITEGIFDCLSIEMLGHKSISLNSVNMSNKLLELIKENIGICRNTKFVIALDNDKKGIEYTDKLIKGLSELNIKAVKFEMDKNYKDINEYYLGNLSALKTNLEDLSNGNFKEFDKNSFYLNVDNYLQYSKLNTGFKQFDDKLNGIMPGLYVVGAETGLGKTTFMLQIADQIARQGKKVLFYSLEMTKFEMLCKSLNRIAYTDHNRKISIKDIMYNTDRDLTENCINSYMPISKNLEIVEGGFNLDMDTISKSIFNYISMLDDKPIIFIDYLQIIEPKDDKGTDKTNMDYTIKMLKKISRKYFIPIFLISSLNRQSYHTDLTNASFKESGSIEYTSDVMLGLQSKIIDELKYLSPNSKKDLGQIKDIWNRYKIETKETGIKKTKLKCLKNRFGKKDFDIDFNFYGQFGYFEESQNNQNAEIITFPTEEELEDE
jgi:replicative DNA helicase